MSDVTLFLFGALVSLLWGAAALGPFLFAASKAELDWRKRKKEKGDLGLLRTSPPSLSSDSKRS
jgi:hypothetical protein